MAAVKIRTCSAPRLDIARVSGGGEWNLLNDIPSDPTTTVSHQARELVGT